jgi:hypothetical protein
MISRPRSDDCDTAAIEELGRLRRELEQPPGTAARQVVRAGSELGRFSGLERTKPAGSIRRLTVSPPPRHKTITETEAASAKEPRCRTAPP